MKNTYTQGNGDGNNQSNNTITKIYKDTLDKSLDY